MVARTAAECAEIKANNYVATNAGLANLNQLPWRTVSNPETASTLPWK